MSNHRYVELTQYPKMWPKWIEWIEWIESRYWILGIWIIWDDLGGIEKIKKSLEEFFGTRYWLHSLFLSKPLRCGMLLVSL